MNRCYECESELTLVCQNCNTRPTPDATDTVSKDGTDGLETAGWEYRYRCHLGGDDGWSQWSDWQIGRFTPTSTSYKAEERELVTRQNAEAVIAAERMKLEATARVGLQLSEKIEALKAELDFIGRVKGVNEKYANALAFLEMTENDDPEEFAECFWNKFIALEADNAALTARIKELEMTVQYEIDVAQSEIDGRRHYEADNKRLRDVLAEYIEARDEYEKATAPSEDFGTPTRLNYFHPIGIWYRAARAALGEVK